MRYLKLIDGAPKHYNIFQIRRDFPKVSFPQTLRSSFLRKYNIFPYTMDEEPEFDEDTQEIVEGDFYQDSEGEWRREWKVLDASVPDEDVRSYAANLLRIVSHPYSEEERETWEEQKKDAEEFLKNPGADAPYVKYLATVKGISEKEVAETIVRKAKELKHLRASILAAQEALIRSEPTPLNYMDKKYWPRELAKHIRGKK